MTQNRQINKRKLWQFIIAAALLCITLPMIIYAVSSHRSNFIDKVEVIYHNDKHVYISHDAVVDILSSMNGKSIFETEIRDLDLTQLETALHNHPWIKNVELYINARRKLTIELLQNQPIARVFYTDNTSEYIDSNGVSLPLDYIYPLPIPFFTNVPHFNDTIQESSDLKSAIMKLSKTIINDEFWNAQITQINVNPSNEFDISTLMGDFVVKLGQENDFREKLHNLQIFFNKGLNKLGWDTYRIIDMRYNGQIVASPALDYIAPPPSDTMINVPEQEETIDKDTMLLSPTDTSTA